MWLFNKKEKKPKFVPKKYVIFNVDTFNTWFNDKDNGAVYAHSGIFLRTDKLDLSQIKDYMVKCHGLNLDEWDTDLEIYRFHEEIEKDWRKKLNDKNK